MGLDREKTAHTLALAAVPYASMNQTRTGQLSMWKGCAGPNAARNGIFAAMMAARGMTGPGEAFDGPRGFKRMLGSSFELPPFGVKGVPFTVETAKYKCYPCDYEAQCSVTPALELHAALKGRTDTIQSVEVETYEF